MKYLLLLSVCILPLWWIFLVLWQPGFVHLVARLSYLRSPLSISQETALAARERALLYATRGTQQTEDIYFSENEIAHLRDVSLLYKPVQLGLNILAIGSWSVLLLSIIRKTKIRNAFRRGAKVIAGIMGFLLISLIFFQFFFLQFHKVLFPQGNWSFPEDSMLILIFPEFFWQLLLGSSVVLLALFALLFWMIGNRHE